MWSDLFKAAQKAAQASFKAAMNSATEQSFIPTKSVMGYMKTDDFINLRGFGLNRDVEKRIKADRNTHLKGELTSEQQRKVVLFLRMKLTTLISSMSLHHS